jgi:hypothetical protein
MLAAAFVGRRACLSQLGFAHVPLLVVVTTYAKKGQPSERGKGRAEREVRRTLGGASEASPPVAVSLGLSPYRQIAHPLGEGGRSPAGERVTSSCLPTQPRERLRTAKLARRARAGCPESEEVIKKKGPLRGTLPVAYATSGCVEGWPGFSTRHPALIEKAGTSCPRHLRRPDRPALTAAKEPGKSKTLSDVMALLVVYLGASLLPLPSREKAG